MWYESLLGMIFQYDSIITLFKSMFSYQGQRSHFDLLQELAENPICRGGGSVGFKDT